MAGEDFLPEQKPGKEWRITTPDSVDFLKLINGELALRGITQVLGWDFTEVEKPKETPLDEQEMIGVSKDVFGTEAYGKFALSLMSWMRYGAYARITAQGGLHHVNFTHSTFHNHFPTFEERLDVESYASHKEMRKAAMPLIDTMGFPFRHTFQPYDRHTRAYNHPSHGRVWHHASLVADTLTKERLTSWLQTPLPGSNTTPGGELAPSNHNLHGTIGRTFDLLSLLAGVKTSVDPAITESPGGVVDYKEFQDFAKREGVPAGRLRTLTSKIQRLAMRQLRNGHLPAWGEVVLDGDTQLYAGTNEGFRGIYVDQVSTSTLATIKNEYERLSPELAAVLSAYE